MLKHKLNEHATKEEREKEFKYYCFNCDFGTFSSQLYKKHEETKKHISSVKKEWYKTNKHPLWGKTTYEVTSPTGEKFIISGGWKQWCIDRGLNASNMLKVAKGERKQCKGWKAKIINE